MESFSLIKKTYLALFISIPITFFSSFIKYGDNFSDGLNYVGFPFWKEKSGGFAGIVVRDNLALIKNFIFWFLLAAISLFLFGILLKKLKRS